MTAAAPQLGIEDISLATSGYVFDLADLAAWQGIDPDKYRVGIGQNRMSFPTPDEDIVTMAAEAALPLLEGQDLRAIRTVLFATESGIDQSKSAAVYVHALLGLSPNARVVELKQACYSATSALQMALAIVARNPEQKVLVLASDIARYEAGSSGESTQGAAAIAMLISNDPKVLVVEPGSGLYTTDVMDFWRPNYRREALVDGKYSVKIYLEAVAAAWRDYREQGGRDLETFDHFCYHQPFTRMAAKAHRHLARVAGGIDNDTADAQLEHTFDYNRELGNSYTASIYAGLVSLIDASDEDLSGHCVGFFSYGSGAVAELFSGVLQPGYRSPERAERHRRALARRRPISYDEYSRLHAEPEPVDGGEHVFARVTSGPFRLAGIAGHERRYESTSATAS